MATSLTGSWMKMSPAMSSLMARLETLVQRKTFGTVESGRQFLFNQPLHFERALKNFVGSFFQPFIEFFCLVSQRINTFWFFHWNPPI